MLGSCAVGPWRSSSLGPTQAVGSHGRPTQLATRQDLAALGSELRADMAEVKGDVKAEMAELRGDVKEALAQNLKVLVLTIVSATVIPGGLITNVLS